MEDRIRFSLLSEDGARLEKMVSYVNIPAASGSVGVLPGHLPMLCALDGGVVRCGSGGGTLRISVGRGIAHVAGDEAVILVTTAQELQEP